MTNYTRHLLLSRVVTHFPSYYYRYLYVFRPRILVYFSAKDLSPVFVYNYNIYEVINIILYGYDY